MQLKSARSLYQLHQYYINWRAGVIDRSSDNLRAFWSKKCADMKKFYTLSFLFVFFFTEHEA